jgi:hypothetical protein
MSVASSRPLRSTMSGRDQLRAKGSASVTLISGPDLSAKRTSCPQITTRHNSTPPSVMSVRRRRRVEAPAVVCGQLAEILTTVAGIRCHCPRSG